MAAERLSMRKVREIARLYLLLKLSGRAIGRSVGVSPSTMSDYLGRLRAAELTWPLPPELDNDEALERRLFPEEAKALDARPMPDYAHVHRELAHRHVTKLLLWQEYKTEHPDGVGYSQFCTHYAAWAKPLGATMRQAHRAGGYLFVDFSGDTIDIVDPVTGEIVSAKLFVAVLGASNLTYVEPVLTEDLPTWIGCHVRAFDFFGGVPEIVVPDNLKAGVRRSDRYDPDINPTYAELARHYKVAVIPARPRKPRDKAKVEQAVLLAERWVLAVLRHRRFRNLDDLRAAVAELNTQLNDRKMRKLGVSRRALFEQIERAALQPLPEQRYEHAAWARPTVGPDYHVEYEKHYYSVPYRLCGQRVDVRATMSTIEILHLGERVASHPRSARQHAHTTLADHMPASHREHAKWTPERIQSWARTLGPQVAALSGEIMKRRMHPEQGYRSCLGLIRLANHYGAERLNAACAHALKIRATSRKSVESILKNGLDQTVAAEPVKPTLASHENVRGPDYYN